MIIIGILIIIWNVWGAYYLEKHGKTGFWSRANWMSAGSALAIVLSEIHKHYIL